MRFNRPLVRPVKSNAGPISSRDSRLQWAVVVRNATIGIIRVPPLLPLQLERRRRMCTQVRPLRRLCINVTPMQFTSNKNTNKTPIGATVSESTI